MVKTYINAKATSVALAEEIAACIARSTGDFHFVVSGGSSPIETFHHLRTLDIPWERVHVWLADERFVPVGDEGSNEALVRRELTDHVGIDLARVHGMLKAPTALACADAYAKILPDVLDFVLLGMGEDGHTASLFPGSPALRENYRRVAAAPGAEPYPQRITLTFAPLGDAKMVAVIATGEAKAAAYAAAQYDDSELPIAVASRLARNFVWYVDEAVAPPRIIV